MYGFKEVMNLYQSTDNIRYPMDDIQTMFKVLDILPKQNPEDNFEVIFMLGELMVTEGNIDKENGRGNVFGFNAKTKLWEDQPVHVAFSSFINDFSYGNIIIDDNGNAVGANKRPFTMGAKGNICN